MCKVATHIVSNEVVIFEDHVHAYQSTCHVGPRICLDGLEGCMHIQSVEPWQKGNLAKPEMTFDDDPLERGFKEHIYSSKEASAGGSGVGGGGCGCN